MEAWLGFSTNYPVGCLKSIVLRPLLRQNIKNTVTSSQAPCKNCLHGAWPIMEQARFLNFMKTDRSTTSEVLTGSLICRRPDASITATIQELVVIAVLVMHVIANLLLPLTLPLETIMGKRTKAQDAHQNSDPP
jgi:hypothetical protein